MRYNLVIAVISLILLAISTLFEVNYIDYGFPVPYSQHSSITFKDFRGHAKPGLTLDGSREFAYISIDRKIRYLSDSSVEITTFFHPSRSYVYNQHIRSEELLKHELYHFHIAEVFTRRIKSAISIHGETMDKVKNIVEQYILEEKYTQLKYDEETYHSYVLSEQKRWEKDIDTQIWELKKFENAVINFPK